MGDRSQPRYPVYVISKGRPAGYTARFLTQDQVPFRLVIEPQEFDEYAANVNPDLLVTLPFSNLGQGSIPARNWCWENARSEGHERHWILDDNIARIYRRWRGERVPCKSGPAFRVIEDFTDRYENIAVAGMNYTTFIAPQSVTPPFKLNSRVYSCLLIRNDLPFRWRGRYNEDTDLCLQALSQGWCTVLINAFAIDKTQTLRLKGGNSDELYQGDGRLRMARDLERQWPHVTTTRRKFGRPQHHVPWAQFTTPLKRRTDINWEALQTGGPDEYDLTLTQTGPLTSPTLQTLKTNYDQHNHPRTP